RADQVGLALEDEPRLLGLWPGHRGTPGAHDAGLVPGDLAEALAERGRVVVADRRDRRGQWIDNIRRVEAAAGADFEDGHVGPLLGEVGQGEGGPDFERRRSAQLARNLVDATSDRTSAVQHSIPR